MTASSTSAAIRRGLLTETSTPHWSVNSHSFSARLTRATTRLTANSVLASSDTHQVDLVVAGGGDHDVAGLQAAPPAGWPARTRRPAPTRPAARAPAAASRRLPLDQHDLVAVVDQLGGDGPADVAGSGDRDAHDQCPPSGVAPVILRDRVDHVVGDQHEDLVAVLQHGGRGGQRAEAEPHDVRDPAAGRLLQRRSAVADPVRVQRHLDDRDRCWSGRATARCCASGIRWRSIRSAVQRTVATVGMPSRS